MFEMIRWWSSVEQVEIVEWDVCEEACSLKKELGRKSGKEEWEKRTLKEWRR